MYHKDRVHTRVLVVGLPELAHELHRVSSWTLCTGFEVRVGEGVSWLAFNDALSEDGAQEYAILLCEGTRVRQVESFTVSWSTEQETANALRDLETARQAGTLKMMYRDDVQLPTEQHPENSCHLCA